jgi:hypothetical protein
MAQDERDQATPKGDDPNNQYFACHDGDPSALTVPNRVSVVRKYKLLMLCLTADSAAKGAQQHGFVCSCP